MVINRLLSWQGLLDSIWLIFLVLMLYHFWRVRLHLSQTKNWLITKGRITYFEWTAEENRLWPKIEYIYQVCNQDVHGHYFFLDTSHNNPCSKYARKVAYRAAIAFENNDEVDVYYNPNHPEQSALDISIPKKLNIIVVLLLGLLILHSLVMAIRLLR